MSQKIKQMYQIYNCMIQMNIRAILLNGLGCFDKSNPKKKRKKRTNFEAVFYIIIIIKEIEKWYRKKR